MFVKERGLTMKKEVFFIGAILVGVMLVFCESMFAYAVQKPIELRWGVNYPISSLDPASPRTDWDYMAHVNVLDTLIDRK